MRVLVIANKKGGSGKSCISSHLAVEAERSGHGPVVLMDTDPQGSNVSWWNKRKAETPAFAMVDINNLPSQIKSLAATGIKLCVIDTPAVLLDVITICIGIADLVIIPVKPGIDDIEAFPTTLEITQKAQKDFIFVANEGGQRKLLTLDTITAISQFGRVIPIFQRNDLSASRIDGRVAYEINPKGDAAKEITNLWKIVLEYLK